MIEQLIFLCIAGFLAAFIDAIAGGGGIISLPALMISGVSPHYALGTNKFASSTGSFTSALRYIKSEATNNDLLKKLIPFTILGSILGVKTVLNINENILNILVLVLILAVGIYTIRSKSIGAENTFEGLTDKNIKLGIILAFSLGFYDGFFGPGTGTFLMFGLIKIYGFDFLNSSGNTKVLNFVSNITSLILFAINGQILYKIGIPFAISMILGAQLGSRLAISKGVKLIKPIFITMSLGVAIKVLYQMI